MDQLPPSPFWNFSLAVYGRPGVAAACIELQDRHGLDVNLLLFACWRAAMGEPRWSPARLLAMMRGLGDWQVTVVAPLRAVRRRLKRAPGAAPEALRRQIGEIELAAERIEQDMLAALLAIPARAVARNNAAACGTAIANLRTYGEVAAIAWHAEDVGPLACLLTAAFPAVTDAACRALLLSALAQAPPPRPSA
jgi:uncharacterized protein (TIGR02444 family)